MIIDKFRLYEWVDAMSPVGQGFQEILSEAHMQYMIDYNHTLYRDSQSTNWKVTITDGREEAIAAWRKDLNEDTL